MVSVIVAAGLTAVAITCVLFKYLVRPSLSKIRGPKSSSFILGNLLELFQHSVGQSDFEWQHLYGGVVRFKTVFKESIGDQLLISDPKALQHILNTKAYQFPKQPNLRIISILLGGKGIGWADGESHKRQRKILLPGFGASESKAFLSIFQECAELMSDKWMEIITSNTDQKAVIDVPAWLSRAALDAIGEAAFDIRFDTLHKHDHPLAKQYNNMMSDVFGRPSAQQIFVQAASMYVPSQLLEWIAEHGSNPRLKRSRMVKNTATKVAAELIREKSQSLLAGKGSRDIFTLLVKANMDTEAKDKLTGEELLTQMRTILVAGHETTANTLSWILLELARHPEIQCKLRSEIHRMEATVRTRGETQLTMTDFDAMPYTTAVVKEGLRYHPVLPYVQRIASKYDVLPLSQSITTETGEVINEVVVPKGTRMVLSIAAYNRNTELWGTDAHEFNPDRWLDGMAKEKKSVSIGVYANLMTFLSGARACLGWRFALIEIQAILVDIISKFEFAMTDEAERLHRELSLVMTPTIDGKGQLPLVVSVAPREDN